MTENLGNTVMILNGHEVQGWDEVIKDRPLFQEPELDGDIKMKIRIKNSVVDGHFIEDMTLDGYMTKKDDGYLIQAVSGAWWFEMLLKPLPKYDELYEKALPKPQMVEFTFNIEGAEDGTDDS